MKGPRPFPRGDKKEIAKIHWWNFKIFFSRTIEPISTQLGTKHPLVKGIQVFTNKDHSVLKKWENVFVSLHQYFCKCDYWNCFSDDSTPNHRRATVLQISVFILKIQYLLWQIIVNKGKVIIMFIIWFTFTLVWPNLQCMILTKYIVISYFLPD